MKDFDRLVDFCETWTNGEIKTPTVGGNLGRGTRYGCREDQTVWLGSQGGRWVAAHYYAGAIMKWTQMAGKTLPLEISDLIAEIGCATPKRWHKRANESWENGRGRAESRFCRTMVLAMENSEGIPFFAVYEEPHTGSNGYSMPSVAFYDRRYDHVYVGYYGGQFTGGRYFVDTLMGRFAKSVSDYDMYGLDLCGHVDAWKLSPANMRSVRDWLVSKGHEVRPEQDAHYQL